MHLHNYYLSIRNKKAESSAILGMTSSIPQKFTLFSLFTLLAYGSIQHYLSKKLTLRMPLSRVATKGNKISVVDT